MDLARFIARGQTFCSLPWEHRGNAEPAVTVLKPAYNSLLCLKTGDSETTCHLERALPPWRGPWASLKGPCLASGASWQGPRIQEALQGFEGLILCLLLRRSSPASSSVASKDPSLQDIHSSHCQKKSVHECDNKEICYRICLKLYNYRCPTDPVDLANDKKFWSFQNKENVGQKKKRDVFSLSDCVTNIQLQ